MRFPWISIGLAGFMAMTSLEAQAAQEWPGPTPRDVVDAKMKAKRVKRPDEQELQKMEAAAPGKAPARPARRRKVLVWGHLWTHGPNAFAEEAVKILGKKSGAFEAVANDDPRLLLAENLEKFDAILMNNIHEREPFMPGNLRRLPKGKQFEARKLDKAIKKSILDFVSRGKGIVGVHASNCALQNWKEYGEMMGGYFGGYIFQDLAIKMDDPGHPVNACFGGKTFRIHDEIYIFTGPYSRKNLRILLSLDPSQMKFPKKISLPRPGLEQGRPDKDHGISWVRRWGKGRVFYTTLGHCEKTYWNPVFLKHLLAGIQFAIGDLPGETAPSAK